MKIAGDMLLDASPETIWAALTDFASYPEWNPLVKSLAGEVAPQSKVQVTVNYPGTDLLKGVAEITGWNPPKYFSFQLRKGPSWWYQEEHVFRIKVRENGKVEFHNEIYATGLSLRFGRKDSAHRMRHSVDRMNEELKERIQAA